MKCNGLGCKRDEEVYPVVDLISGEASNYCVRCILPKLHRVLWAESNTNHYTRTALATLKKLASKIESGEIKVEVY